ncbi:hypothetical protein ACIRPT_37200 [Streptomyces sp. NPDC101227]|uniref:hypothetical protein n=1 Tax=Streptomyces sp. NPDC101227 TaxID=3366136 RepID=UPI003809DE96
MDPPQGPRPPVWILITMRMTSPDAVVAARSVLHHEHRARYAVIEANNEDDHLPALEQVHPRVN